MSQICLGRVIRLWISHLVFIRSSSTCLKVFAKAQIGNVQNPQILGFLLKRWSWCFKQVRLILLFHWKCLVYINLYKLQYGYRNQLLHLNKTCNFIQLVIMMVEMKIFNVMILILMCQIYRSKRSRRGWSGTEWFSVCLFRQNEFKGWLCCFNGEVFILYSKIWLNYNMINANRGLIWMWLKW